MSGLPRRVPVGNGMRDDTFWIVIEHGYGTDYVGNIQRDPRMRVKVGADWREGIAQILPTTIRCRACAGWNVRSL